MFVGATRRTHPYCRITSVSHPTAMLFHTRYPADAERNAMTGIESKKTTSGMRFVVYGLTMRKMAAMMSPSHLMG